MGVFIVTAPDGRKVKLTGDAPPTDADLDEVFSSLPPIEGQESSLGDKALGLGETALAMGSSIAAEPLSGLAGLANMAQGNLAEGLERQGLDNASDFVKPDLNPGQVVEQTRQDLTYQPRTQEGQENLSAIGETLKPIGDAFNKAETVLGDTVFKATGSPALAAAATTIPTLATEVLGIAAGKGMTKMAQRTKRAREAGQIARDINNALPSKDQLLDTSRGIFKEIDETGAVLKSEPFDKMVGRLEKLAESKGIDADITPLSAKALQRLQDAEGRQLTLIELDNLREVAKNAISAGGKDGSIAMGFVDEIDDLLNSVTSKSFAAGDNVAEIGKKYGVARDLWGRAKRSDMLEEAFEKARNQASGFENGVRTQFRQILNNKNKRKFFKPDEITAMNRVVRGDKAENFARLIGRFGFSEGSAHNVLTGMAGVGAGAAAGGVGGAMIVPLVGQVSRKLAQRMTVKNAEFADAVIRSGKDAKKIATAYRKFTPSKERNASELSELLMKNDIDLKVIKGDELLRSAAELATQNRAATVGAGAVTSAQGLNTQQEEQVNR